ncbi:flagellar basal body-associated FliL family protein [Bdellovibrionota bacterium FG-1]
MSDTSTPQNAAEKPRSKTAKSAKSAGKVAQKKKKKIKKAPLGDRIQAGLTLFVAQTKEVFRGIRSADRPTRKMSYLFLASLGGLVVVSILTVHRGWLSQANNSQDRVAQVEVLEKPKKTTHGKAEGKGRKDAHGGVGNSGDNDKPLLTMLPLGDFTVELKPLQGRRVKTLQANLADVGIVLECDSNTTYVYLEQRVPQIRNQLTDVFLMIERDELLTREGKQRLKGRLLDQLNTWLPKGKIRNIFFSKLLAT